MARPITVERFVDSLDRVYYSRDVAFGDISITGDEKLGKVMEAVDHFGKCDGDLFVEGGSGEVTISFELMNWDDEELKNFIFYIFG